MALQGPVEGSAHPRLSMEAQQRKMSDAKPAEVLASTESDAGQSSTSSSQRDLRVNQLLESEGLHRRSNAGERTRAPHARESRVADGGPLP